MISEGNKEFIKMILDDNFQNQKEWVRNYSSKISEEYIDSYLLGGAKVIIQLLVEELQKDGKLIDIKTIS